MQKEDFKLRRGADYIELCKLLKLTGLADSGGQGKVLVASGQVRVDAQVELQKTAKIRAGQTVFCQEREIHVCAATGEA